MWEKLIQGLSKISKKFWTSFGKIIYSLWKSSTFANKIDGCAAAVVFGTRSRR